MAGQFIDLREALRIAPAGPSAWSGKTIGGGPGAAFGGHMAAQAMLAACAIEPGRTVQSMHTFFLNGAKPDQMITHEVEALQTGRTFSRVRVQTRQGERRCLTSAVSFHEPEPAPEYQAPAPLVGLPDDYPTITHVPENTNPGVRLCFDLRPIRNVNAPNPQRLCWVRYRGDLGDDPVMHCAALIWVADFTMPWTARLPYDESHGRGFGTSLDHTLWFHRPARADRWMLSVQESVVFSGARALTHAAYFDERGARIASAAQETLWRLPEE